MAIAEVAMKHQQNKSSFRNIRINDDTPDDVIEQIQSDDIAKEIQIKNIRTKSSRIISIECADDAQADRLQELLLAKYSNYMSVDPIRPVEPQLKIIHYRAP